MTRKQRRTNLDDSDKRAIIILKHRHKILPRHLQLLFNCSSTVINRLSNYTCLFNGRSRIPINQASPALTQFVVEHAIIVGYCQHSLSLSRIAKCLNLTVFQVRNILIANGMPLRPSSAKRSPDASQQVNIAVKRGDLSPLPCEICQIGPNDQNGNRIVIAHHDNYNYPLVVRWLCHTHHGDWHRHNKPVMEGNTAHA